MGERVDDGSKYRVQICKSAVAVAEETLTTEQRGAVRCMMCVVARQSVVNSRPSVRRLDNANNLFLSATAGEETDQWGKETSKGIKGKGAKGN